MHDIRMRMCDMTAHACHSTAKRPIYTKRDPYIPRETNNRVDTNDTFMCDMVIMSHIFASCHTCEYVVS